jgi:excisionase family DNA binding protein
MAHAPRLTMSVEEAAEAIGLPYRSVQKMIKRGELPAITVGRRHLVLSSALDALCAAAEHRASLLRRAANWKPSDIDADV